MQYNRLVILLNRHADCNLCYSAIRFRLLTLTKDSGMSREFIILAVVMLHFIIGFGWLLYKFEFEKN
jgi:hypothetical protein